MRFLPILLIIFSSFAFTKTEGEVVCMSGMLQTVKESNFMVDNLQMKNASSNCHGVLLSEAICIKMMMRLVVPSFYIINEEFTNYAKRRCKGITKENAICISGVFKSLRPIIHSLGDGKINNFNEEQTDDRFFKAKRFCK